MSAKRICDECGVDVYGPSRVLYASTHSGKTCVIHVSGVTVNGNTACDLCEPCLRNVLKLLLGTAPSGVM